jgi:hypothetical protein
MIKGCKHTGWSDFTVNGWNWNSYTNGPIIWGHVCYYHADIIKRCKHTGWSDFTVNGWNSYTNGPIIWGHVCYYHADIIKEKIEEIEEVEEGLRIKGW